MTAPTFYPLTGVAVMIEPDAKPDTPRIALMVAAGIIVAAKSSEPMDMVICNTDAIGKKDKLKAIRLWQAESAKMKYTPDDGDPDNTSD